MAGWKARGLVLATVVLASNAFWVGSGRGGVESAGQAMAVASSDEETARSALKQMIRDLGSSENPVQERARKQLAAVPYGRRAMLRALSDGIVEEEVRSLVGKRLAEMDEHLALDPLPVSLHVKDASLAEVAAMLSLELGTEVKTVILRDAGSYTADMDGKPFWELIQALNQQHPIGLMGHQDQYYLTDTDAGIGNAAIQGPFMLAASVRRMRSAPNQPPAPERLVLVYTLAADPRVRLVGLKVDVKSAVDDTGHELAVAQPGGPPRDMVDASVHSGRLGLALPAEKLGTRISLLKVHARLVVSLVDDEAVVEDLATKVNQDFPVGQSTVKVTQFVSTDKGFQLTVQAAERGNYVTVRLLDSTGAVAFGFTNLEMIGVGSSSKPVGPFKLQIKMPRKTKEIETDFELKDVPLPGPALP